MDEQKRTTSDAESIPEGLPEKQPNQPDVHEDSTVASSQDIAPTIPLQETANNKLSKLQTLLHNKKFMLVGAGLLTLGLIGLSAWFLFLRGTEDPATSPETAQDQAPITSIVQEPDAQDPKGTIAVAITPVKNRPNYSPLTSATWLTEPAQLDYQPVFNIPSPEIKLNDGAIESEGERNNVSFYQVGQDGNKTILIATIESEFGFTNPSLYLFTKEDTRYELIEANSSYSYQTDSIRYEGPALSEGVLINKDVVYADIDFAETIVYKGAVLERISFTHTLKLDDTYSNLTKLDDTSIGTLYKSSYAPNADLAIATELNQIYLRQKSGVYVLYRYVLNTQDNKYINDDNSIPIDWDDGTNSTDIYQWMTVRYGCGIFSSINVMPEQYRSDLQASGKTKDKTVYTFKTPDAPTFKQVYENYNPQSADSNRSSIQQMFDNRGVIVIENALGQLVVLVKNDYQSMGECAKPVIYLYPTQPTQLHVAVGADVTVSEPLYKNGWDVYAKPNGQLLVDGNWYGNLFWEGTGEGIYPDISGHGFVVARSDVKQTLTDHLQKLGLNSQESADFLEFWLPLMPETPYTRITWLGTQDMNRLAPLALSRQPDTLIRIFIDFEGLDAPVQLKTQKLSHPPRTGFTVIEWGGLRTIR